CDPAAERGELERLREVAQRVAVATKLILEGGPRGAGLNARGPRGGVDIQHAAEPAQVDRDRAPELLPHPGLHAADNARAAPVGNCCNALRRTPLEDPLDVLLGARMRDQVRRVIELAAKIADHVVVGLAEGMDDTVVSVSGEELFECVCLFYFSLCQRLVIEW